MSRPSIHLHLAVIGDPVDHSKSPELHQGFMKEANIQGTYEAIRVTKDEIEETLARLAYRGYTGLNVTTPLKEEILKHVGEVDEIAQLVGAANTLSYDAKKRMWLATNTDGVGALTAMTTALGCPVTDKHILMLGAGPTARAAVYALTHAGAKVVVWNRSIDRGRALAERCGAHPWIAGYGTVDAVFSALPPEPWLAEDITKLLKDTAVIVDANYGERATLGAQLEIPIFTGEVMLEAQARESFRLWREAAEATTKVRV